MWALAFTLVGLAMVAGGVYGMIRTYTDDDDDEPASAASTPSIAPPAVDFSSIGATESCTSIDPRLSSSTLDANATDGNSGFGTISVRCGGDTPFFSIEIEEADNPEDYVFADVFLYKSKKQYEKIGTAFYHDTTIDGLAGVPPGTDITEYDSIVIVPRAIGDNSTKPKPIAFEAPF
jgi:hypothetical protein